MKGSALHYSRGVGLIEVLITMLLLSTALLTLAALQTRALQYNQSSYFRSQANILTYDILDKIRANNKQMAAYNFALATFSGVTAPNSSSSLDAVDVYEWRRDVDTKLPSAKAGITCEGASRVCTVTVNWSELNTSEHNFGSGTTDDITAFSYMTRIPESNQ